MERFRVFVFAGIFLAGCVAFVPCDFAYAEATDVEAEEEVPSEFELKREHLIALKDESDRLEETIAETEGIDEEILKSEIDRVRIEFVRGLHEVAQMALDEDLEADMRTEARDAVVAPMEKIAEPFVAYIDDIKKQISTVAEERNQVDAAGVLALEQKFDALVAKQDLLYQLLADHTALLARLDLDFAQLQSALVKRSESRAQLTAGRIHLALDQSAQLKARTNLEPDNAELQAQLTAETERTKTSVASLSSTVAIMKDLELDTTQYQQLLLSATGEFSTDILDKEVALGLISGWWRQIGDWFSVNGLNVVIKFVIFFAIMAVFRILSGFASRLVKKAMSSSKVQVSTLLAAMLERAAGTFVMVAGLLVALSQLGISVGPLVAGLGIAGFIVGFALQDTLANFASGMMILFYRPFDVGDVIEAAAVTGKVSNMNLVSTTILTFDNQTLILPNSKIWGDVIRNITAQNKRRVDLVFGIGYGDDIDKAQGVLKDIISKHELILPEPEPVVEVHTLNESSVDFVVRPWTKTSDYWRVYWDLTKQVKQRFDEEGISIPFPQRDLHMFTDDDAIRISQAGAAPAEPRTAGASKDAVDDNGNAESYAAKEVEAEGDPAS